MSQPVTTGAGSTTTFVIRWVQEMQVDALVHATDNFNLLLSIMLGFLAAAAAAGIALGAGALHPVLIYLILIGCGGCAALAGFLTWREHGNVCEVRQDPGCDDGVSRPVHAEHRGERIANRYRGRERYVGAPRTGRS
jgi:hypothetical protein